MNKDVLPLILKYYNSEMRSHNLYLNLAMLLAQKNFTKFAKQLEMMAEDKRNAHMTRTMRFLSSVGEAAIISSEYGHSDGAMPEFKENDGLPLILEIFQYVLDNEKSLQSEINVIAAETLKKRAFSAFNYIQWFVTDAWKDINSVEEIIFRIKHPVVATLQFGFDKEDEE